jgi:polysaccharide export outer membrane protein
MQGKARLCQRAALTLLLWLGCALTWALPQDYQIGAGDTLKVTVDENPDLATEARVLQNGQIRFPLIELVSVAGLTVDQAEDLIAQKLREGNFVLHPHVNLAITSYRSQQVSVLGYVGKPGLYPLEKPTRLSDLLAQVGGIQPSGSDELVIQRGDGEHHVRLTIDQNQAFLDGDASKDIAIQAGDIIYVPKAPVYYIQGEVGHAGPLRVERGMTVHQALAAAGGAGPRGSERSVRIKRRNALGALEVHAAALDEPVQADDVLTVELWQFYIYGEVQRPGAYRVDPQLSLQQALVIGGGATARGSNKALRVYRRHPDGETEILDSLKLTDPVLPDDVIFVRERLF